MNAMAATDTTSEIKQWRGRNVLKPSLGVSTDAAQVSKWLQTFSAPSATFAGRPEARWEESIALTLYSSLASYKIHTSLIAMHLPDDWRTKLFKQLDCLLEIGEWDEADVPPHLASYNTFIRLLLNLRPRRRPGLGASHDGHFIATWTLGDDRLTFECLPKDQVKWSLSRTVEGERERAVGITTAARIADVISPYEPDRWLSVDDDSLRST